MRIQDIITAIIEDSFMPCVRFHVGESYFDVAISGWRPFVKKLESLDEDSTVRKAYIDPIAEAVVLAETKLRLVEKT